MEAEANFSRESQASENKSPNNPEVASWYIGDGEKIKMKISEIVDDDKENRIRETETGTDTDSSVGNASTDEDKSDLNVKEDSELSASATCDHDNNCDSDLFTSNKITDIGLELYSNEKCPSQLDFYGPTEIPGLLLICVTIMVLYEEGEHIRGEWFQNRNTTTWFTFSIERLMILMFGIWIYGFVLFGVQFTKYFAMFLNKYAIPKLHLALITRRIKIIYAMLVTKIATTIWMTQSELIPCDASNSLYPFCKSHIMYKISSYLQASFGCENYSSCYNFMNQIPMIIAALFSLFLGKFLLPAAMKKFRRTEELKQEAKNVVEMSAKKMK